MSSETYGNAACGVRSEVAPSLTLPRIAGEGTRKEPWLQAGNTIFSYFAGFAPLRE